MRIGELSRRSGYSIDTLRYYDRIGLVRARRDPSSRFREYGEEALDMLALVRAAKTAQLSLPQIRRILGAARGGAACRQVLPMLDAKVVEIDGAIRALQDLRARLARAMRRGFPRGRAGRYACPILMGMRDKA